MCETKEMDQKLKDKVKGFFQGWKAGKPGHMLLNTTKTYRSNHVKRDIFEWYGQKKLKSFEILSFQQIVPAMIDVKVKIVYTIHKIKSEKIVVARCVCERSAYQAYTDGTWGVNPISVLKENDLKADIK